MRYLSILLSALILSLAALPSSAQSVGSGDIKKNAVRSKHIKKNNVRSSDIKDEGIKTQDLANESVTTAKIENEGVTSTKIATGAVGTPEIADGAVTMTKLDPSVGPGGTLPSGTTLRGLFDSGISAPGAGTKASSNGVSFDGYQLPARPTVHVIGVSGLPTAECPGSVSAPAAESGHLCLYLGFAVAASQVVVRDATLTNGVDYVIDSGLTNIQGDGKVSTVGFAVGMNTGGSFTRATGTWAVKS